jgi:hypothetical protein
MVGLGAFLAALGGAFYLGWRAVASGNTRELLEAHGVDRRPDLPPLASPEMNGRGDLSPMASPGIEGSSFGVEPMGGEQKNPFRELPGKPQLPEGFKGSYDDLVNEMEVGAEESDGDELADLPDEEEPAEEDA